MAKDNYVTNTGEVWKKTRKGWEKNKLSKDSKGYLIVRIKGALKKVHRLVADTYLPNPENLPQINHKDGNKTNNHVDNLEWVTNKENAYHAMSIGKHSNPSVAVIGVNSAGEGLYLASLSEGNFYGIHHPNISKCLKGIRKTAGGYSWSLYE